MTLSAKDIEEEFAHKNDVGARSSRPVITQITIFRMRMLMEPTIRAGTFRSRPYTNQHWDKLLRISNINIRDEKDLQNKTDYIEAHPMLWDEDENNPQYVQSN